MVSIFCIDQMRNYPELIPLDTDSILRPTKEKKQHMLINLGVKHANKPSHKEALVGDGIQHRRIDA
jgi:hypothetical protein